MDAIRIDTQGHSWIVVKRNCEAIIQEALAELSQEGTIERRADALRGRISSAKAILSLGEPKIDMQFEEGAPQLYS